MFVVVDCMDWLDTCGEIIIVVDYLFDGDVLLIGGDIVVVVVD